ncbi:MAG TPA: SRPBCC domain-containing protein [Candidatus Limnocylindrales bacterium]|nr:SRPBCC domain-containing protein [Candidatus Limnocylindrales bacterium]
MDLRTTRTIRSAIEIRAPVELTWQVLTDFASYPEWNPIVRRLRGRPRVGGRVVIRSQPPGARSLVHRPRMMVWTPPQEMRWQTTVLAKSLFTGEHGFRLEPIGADRTRFVQDETFRGLLVPLYSRLRLPATRRGFVEMNEALRDRVERLAGGASAPAAGSRGSAPGGRNGLDGDQVSPSA